MDAPLVVHHIGARGETQAFPKLPAFEGDIVNVLYDADGECLADVKALNKDSRARVVVVPRCISGKDGARIFLETVDPYGNSLLPIDGAMGDLYVRAEWLDHDYGLNEALAPKRSVPMQASTLDAVVADSQGAIPAPDFLSLDTQGSELEILQGAPASLASAVCVVSEVEFLPLYEGQPLFGEVCRFMQANGFVFCRFFSILGGAPFRAPLGLRGEEIPVTTDALFLRRPDTILHSDPLQRHLALRKLTFTAVINGYVDHAVWALTLDQDGARPKRVNANWYRFVAEFADIVARFPAFYPDSFSERQQRADVEACRQALRERFAAAAPALREASQSLEALLLRHGLVEQQRKLRTNTDIALRQAGLTLT